MASFSDERIAAIIRGRREVRRIHFAPLNCDIGIRALTEAEIDAARLEAAAYFTKAKASIELDPEFLDREVRRQLIWRSVLDPDAPGEDKPPFFPSDADVRKLDAAMVHLLFAAYLETQEEIVPSSTLSEEEVSALVEALGKEDTGERLLISYGPDTLRRCVRSLASHLRASSQAGRSSTSQP